MRRTISIRRFPTTNSLIDKTIESVGKARDGGPCGSGRREVIRLSSRPARADPVHERRIMATTDVQDEACKAVCECIAAVQWLRGEWNYYREDGNGKLHCQHIASTLIRLTYHVKRARRLFPAVAPTLRRIYSPSVPPQSIGGFSGSCYHEIGIDLADVALWRIATSAMLGCEILDVLAARDVSDAEARKRLENNRALIAKEVCINRADVKPAEWKSWLDALDGIPLFDEDDLIARVRIEAAHGVQQVNAAKTEQGEGNGGVGFQDQEPPRAKAEQFILARDGDGYYLAGFGESGYVHYLKGLDIIARLIQTPGVPVAMIELVGAGDDKRLIHDQRSRQETLDEPAKTAIRNQLTELRADYEKAKADNSTVETDVVEKEIAELESQLLADIGIAGRSRDMNSEAEQLRPTIHGRLRTIYKTLRDTKPPMKELANHLEGAISSESGAFVYRSATPINWTTSPLAKK